MTTMQSTAAVDAALLGTVLAYQADPGRGPRDDELAAAITALCQVHPPLAVAAAAETGMTAWQAAVDDLAGRTLGGTVLADRLTAWMDAGIADLRLCRRDAPVSAGLRAKTDGLHAWRDHLAGRGSLTDCGRARGLHGGDLAAAAAAALLVALDMLAAAVELDLDDEPGSGQGAGREQAAVRHAQALVAAAARRTP